MSLHKWRVSRKCSFYPDKCKVMHIGNHPPATNYTMRQSDNTTLDIRDEMTERDLGVAIDNHLNFKLHISQTVSQVDQETLLYLYKGLIRPKLEYAQAVWNPHLQGNIYAIEAVHFRKFLPLPPPPSEVSEPGPHTEIPENCCYYPPPPPNLVGFWPTESGQITPNLPGGIIGRVPPPNKNPDYAVAQDGLTNKIDIICVQTARNCGQSLDITTGSGSLPRCIDVT